MSAISAPSGAHRTVTAMLLAPPDPQITELVRVNLHQHDPGWPPVLVFCVAVVVLGALFASIVFLRRAWGAARPPARRLDG
jgi:hypothetical protein